MTTAGCDSSPRTYTTASPSANNAGKKKMGVTARIEAFIRNQQQARQAGKAGAGKAGRQGRQARQAGKVGRQAGGQTRTEVVIRQRRAIVALKGTRDVYRDTGQLSAAWSCPANKHKRLAHTGQRLLNQGITHPKADRPHATSDPRSTRPSTAQRHRPSSSQLWPAARPARPLAPLA